MRISDWSSDVCSSDLLGRKLPKTLVGAEQAAQLRAGKTQQAGNGNIGEERRAGRTHVGIGGHQCMLGADYVGSSGQQVGWQPHRYGRQYLIAAENGGIGQVGLRSRTQQQKQRSEEHTSELQSLMRISYAVFCLKKKK